MGEEFYAIIKLVSGEEIFSLTCIDENDGDPVIILSDPVIIKHIQTPSGVFVKVKPWIDLSDDDFFIIKSDKIITMTETTNKKLIELYQKYNNEEDIENLMTENNFNGRVKVSNKMGYISSVKKAREYLENIFKES